jgi:ParB family chromosome partitioning protein
MSAKHAHQLINSSATVEWFTPERYIELARAVLGKIDLDPASCEAGNRIVKADRYFTETDNGYLQEWHGRIFLNPPYSWCYPDGKIPPAEYDENGKKKQGKPKGCVGAQELWSQRLIQQYQAGNVTAAILLVNACVGDAWFIPLMHDYPICFVDRRIRFIAGEHTDLKTAPTKGNSFVYFGDHPDRFEEVFQAVGLVVLPAIEHEDRGVTDNNCAATCAITTRNSEASVTDNNYGP